MYLDNKRHLVHPIWYIRSQYHHPLQLLNSPYLKLADDNFFFAFVLTFAVYLEKSFPVFHQSHHFSWRAKLLPSRRDRFFFVIQQDVAIGCREFITVKHHEYCYMIEPRGFSNQNSQFIYLTKKHILLAVQIYFLFHITMNKCKS